VRGALPKTAFVPVRILFHQAILESIDHGASRHVYRGLLCRDGGHSLRQANSCQDAPSPTTLSL
jgi:hypothetical protein